VNVSGPCSCRDGAMVLCPRAGAAAAHRTCTWHDLNVNLRGRSYARHTSGPLHRCVLDCRRA
jgi:hypothetical protein